MHASSYYPLEVSHFKSSHDARLLDLLWNKYWVMTLSQSPLVSVRPRFSLPLLPSLSTAPSMTDDDAAFFLAHRTAPTPRRSCRTLSPSCATRTSRSATAATSATSRPSSSSFASSSRPRARRAAPSTARRARRPRARARRAPTTRTSATTRPAARRTRRRRRASSARRRSRASCATRPSSAARRATGSSARSSRTRSSTAAGSLRPAVAVEAGRRARAGSCSRPSSSEQGVVVVVVVGRFASSLSPSRSLSLAVPPLVAAGLPSPRLAFFCRSLQRFCLVVLSLGLARTYAQELDSEREALVDKDEAGVARRYETRGLSAQRQRRFYVHRLRL